MEDIIIKVDQANLANYEIVINSSLLARVNEFVAGQNYSSIFILTDKNLFNHYQKTLQDFLPKAKFITIDFGDEHKDLESLNFIWDQLIMGNADRHSLLINFGGGMIGDIGGLASATYMRGIDCINVPTTLLAQVDASVGGKVAVNYSGIKNLIGVFKAPIKILIDTETLKTLPKRELLSGWAEVIKIALTSDYNLWDEICDINPIELDSAQLLKYIVTAIKLKVKIVTEDPYEKNIRKLLNFGHTVGHALESLAFKSDYPLLHGEAVALGMLIEQRIAEKSKIFKGNFSDSFYQILKALSYKVEIPKNLKSEDIYKLLFKDKKNEGNIINWTLINEVGKGCYNQHVELDIIKEVINESY
jgi:3-dehydroquinate synthase